ncbi:hypothetical protein ACLOJK_025066 [Asimina triloba]
MKATGGSEWEQLRQEDTCPQTKKKWDWLLGDSKEAVAYEVLSPKDLAKTVFSRGGWANILCSGRNTEQSMDIALVFIGSQLKSSHLVRKRHADQGLIELLKMSFITSNFSMAFPYVAVSEEKETMENALVSEFTESCQNQLDVNDIAFLESCSVEGEDLKKLRGLDAEYVGSWMQRKQKGKTDLIVFCSQGSSVYEGSGQIQSEGEIFSELIASLKESSATYTVLYASDPYNSLDYSSQPAYKRFLAESSSGAGNSTHCDGVCQIKSTLLEGLFVGIVLLLILISGLCCMMGIDTPSRFETPQDS